MLNTVNPESVRSVDAKTIEELTLVTRRQASRASTFGTFGLDTNRDLLRGVTGKPRDENFAIRVAGADSLTISVPIGFQELGEKCEQLLSAYLSDAYKEAFDFIDHLRIVQDKSLIEKFEESLIADLKEGRTEKMHLAPPEPIDWENVSGFTYRGARHANVYPEMDIDEMVSEINTEALSVNYLRRKDIGVRYRDSERSVDMWPIFSCIAYETESDDRLYVLSTGDWYEVDRDFATRIRDQVSAILSTALILPTARIDENEGVYNDRIAKENDFALMDGQFIQYGGPYDKIELCDLLTPDRHFIHVKRKTRSSTLSHLFAQGLTSAELFLRDQEFRVRARKKLEDVEPALADIIPADRNPNPADYEVAYAIVTKPSRRAKTLPFFSQLNLANAVSRLRGYGYRGSLALIEES